MWDDWVYSQMPNGSLQLDNKVPPYEEKCWYFDEICCEDFENLLMIPTGKW